MGLFGCILYKRVVDDLDHIPWGCDFAYITELIV